MCNLFWNLVPRFRFSNGKGIDKERWLLQFARRGSLERQQPALSPQLMQRIQQVQQKPAATARQREPAGWGMGSPSAPPSTQQV